MRRRMTALLLAAALLLGLLPAALAVQPEQEPAGSFVFAAASETAMAVAPERISYRQGQTIRQALADSGHSFDGLSSGGYIRTIDGVSGAFRIYDDVGDYDLDKQASAIRSLAMIGVEIEQTQAQALSSMLIRMADYRLAETGVQRYPQAAQAYEEARMALFSADADYQTLAENLQSAMQRYEDEVLHGETVTLALALRTLGGSELSGWQLDVTDSYGTRSSFTQQPIALLPGEYAFTLTAADGINSARGSLTVTADGTVQIGGEDVGALCVSDEQWLTAPVLRAQSALTEDVYECTPDGAGQATYLVPENRTGSVYCYVEPGSGLRAGGAYTTDNVALYVCYARGGSTVESPKPWKSTAAAAAQLLGSDGADVQAAAEARLLYGGYTIVQRFEMKLVRTPVLRELAVSCGGVAQDIGFDPEKTQYACSVTAAQATITPRAYSDETSVSFDGRTLSDAEAVTLSLADGSAEAEFVLTRGGRTRTYTITITSVAACKVTLQHEAGTQVAVYNAAGGQIGPETQTQTSSVFPLVPGERYTYVAAANTYFHTTDSFVASAGGSVSVLAPMTDDWLTATQIRNRSSAAKSDAYLAADAFSAAQHAYDIRVPDTQNNLYVWGKENGYTITEPQSGKTVSAGMAESGVNLANVLPSGSAGRTLTLRVTKADDSRYYQDYVFEISRSLTLRDQDGLQAAVDGKSEPLFQLKDDQPTAQQGFDNLVLHYQLNCVRSAAALKLTLKPFGSSYTVKVAGVTAAADETGALTAELPLDSALDTQVFSISLSDAAAPEAGQTYSVRVVKSEAIATTLTLTDSDGSALRRGLIALYDAQSGARMWPDADGSFRLVGGRSYRYTATCAGYVGKEGSFEASETQTALTVQLQKAPAARETGVTGVWPSFRGSDDSNGVVSRKTPVTTQNAVLSWANKLGDGFSANAVGCPILIEEDGYEYLIVYQANRLLKVDALSGTVVASGQMDHSSDFAINSATYADGMLFVGLANGGVQAFYADTLTSAWLYTDPLGGQPNCPITYHDGYLYTGFWFSETGYTNYVCLPVTDENPSEPKEAKLATWTYSSKGGFYWAGAYVTDSYLLVGTDDGDSGCTSKTASLLCLDPATGALLDRLDGLCGDIRCSIAKSGDRFFFTSKGGYFYCVGMTQAEDGSARIDRDSFWAVALDNGVNSPDAPAMSTCTPVIYNNRAYIGVSGESQFGAYSGHNITVIDLSSRSIAYKVPTQGYPQTSGLLTTAYAADGSVYVYFFDNYTPGKLRVLKDRPGQAAPDYLTTETYNSQGKMLSVDTPYVLFTPQDEQAQYAICSPIAGRDGTLYFKNDSAYLMALTNAVTKVEVLTQPEITSYTTDDTFDPTGMTVRLTDCTGAQRTIPVRRVVNGVTIDYFTWSELAVDTADDFILTYKGALYHNDEQGKRENLTGAQTSIRLTVTQGSGTTDSCVAVSEDAPQSVSTRVGEDYTLSLASVFEDADDHALQYTLDAHSYGSRVFLSGETLHFSVPKTGAYTLTLRAQCASGKKASYVLHLNVAAAAEGTDTQYGYDETDAERVTVYVTVSNDGVPLLGADANKTPLARLKVTVPYFDLDLYGLSAYYRYKTSGGKGGYTSAKMVARPTALHLYIYLLERYYLGLDESQCCKGTSGLFSFRSAKDVLNLYGSAVNDDANFNGKSPALSLSGGATSLYMTGFWGHDQNLMYYRNHVYPLMSAGWGATCDYMLLSDGDTIDLAMFTNWSFYRSGAFCRFDQDAYTVPAQEGLKLRTLKYDTRSVADGGTESFTAIGTLKLAVYTADWKPAGSKAVLTGTNGTYTVTFTEPGTYYLLATDPNEATDQASCAPAVAEVTVTEKRAFIPGDVNGDGKVTTKDLTRLCKYLAGAVQLSETQEKAADVNEDGKVTTKDLTRLCKYLAGSATLGS